MKQFSSLVGENGAKIPPLLQVSEFFLARSPEVVNLYKSMDIRNVCVPDHKRRRIKSYKPYWRSKMRIGGGTSRRSRRGRKEYLVDAEKKRLSTHIWHAKRFHMEDIWNMRLPVDVCDKGLRSICRIGSHGCLLHDRSYMDCWKFDRSGLDNLPFKLDGTVKHPKVVSGEFVGTGYIYDESDRLICPYRSLWDKETVVIWTHPSVREVFEVENVLLKERVWFELLGSQAIQVLQQEIPHAVFGLIPGRIIRLKNLQVDLTIVIRDKGALIDLICSSGDAASVASLWQRLVRKTSVIGVNDRHKFIGAKYGLPDFPFDFPYSKAGSRESACVAKKLVERFQKLPKQCKMMTHSVESPFFPDLSLILGECTKHVLVEIVEKGTLQWNSHVYIGDSLVGFVTSIHGHQKRSGIACISNDVVDESAVCKNPYSDHALDVILSACPVPNTESLLIGFKK